MQLTTKKHNPDDLVVAIRGKAVTDSLTVAKAFNKQHDKVLRAIRNLNCSVDFTDANFGVSEYKDSTGRTLPMYTMTRDGFSILVMGFTGKTAMQWKEKYIAAFNHMEAVIQQRSNADWIESRNSGKASRRELTDTVQEFVEYATQQGSTNAVRYYSNISRMINKALFLVGEASPQPFRDLLSSLQLSSLALAEEVCRSSIHEGMVMHLNYKDIYKLAKSDVEQFAGSLRKTRLIAAPQITLQ